MEGDRIRCDPAWMCITSPRMGALTGPRPSGKQPEGGARSTRAELSGHATRPTRPCLASADPPLAEGPARREVVVIPLLPQPRLLGTAVLIGQPPLHMVERAAELVAKLREVGVTTRPVASAEPVEVVKRAKVPAEHGASPGVGPRGSRPSATSRYQPSRPMTTATGLRINRSCDYGASGLHHVAIEVYRWA